MSELAIALGWTSLGHFLVSIVASIVDGARIFFFFLIKEIQESEGKKTDLRFQVPFLIALNENFTNVYAKRSQTMRLFGG